MKKTIRSVWCYVGDIYLITGDGKHIQLLYMKKPSVYVICMEWKMEKKNHSFGIYIGVRWKKKKPSVWCYYCYYDIVIMT